MHSFAAVAFINLQLLYAHVAIDEPKSGLSVSLINSYLVFYIFLFSFLHFSITALLQLGVTTANYSGMIDFLQPRPKDETIAQLW